MGAISFSLDERLLNLLTGALPLQVFVETGTFKGETLRLACRGFKECHSVELSPELYEAAARQFSSQAGVLVSEVSADGLPVHHRQRMA